MGFKVDSSFLRFLTMGALGVQSVARELESHGFSPLELERYSASNKIWATKVKRLRLPDLLCARTGLRVEVRTKSNLMIRMSDAPNNPERAWDAGLRPRDLVAIIACANQASEPVIANHATYFSVSDLQASVDASTLGRMKAQSEGAEQDRTWPAVVPRRSGEVISVTSDKLVVKWTDNVAATGGHTFRVAGKNVYVKPGDRVEANVDILAGAPGAVANLARFLRDTYDPIEEINSDDHLDRYAAAKALRVRRDLGPKALRALEARLSVEHEPRVALEVAASAASLGSAAGEKYVADALRHENPSELGMEAVLIATELRTPFAYNELLFAARSFASGDERRQAAIWGLGKAGFKSYSDLIDFIADEDAGAALHAISAFGSDTPEPVVTRLVEILLGGDIRTAPAASESLRRIGNPHALTRLIEASSRGGAYNSWALATLGRLPASVVRERLKGQPLLERLEPLLLVGNGATWLSTEDAALGLTFLAKQRLFGFS